MLSIGGVCIETWSHHGLSEADHPHYLPFVTASGEGAPCASTMDVEVLNTLCPPTAEPVIFESGETWRMQVDGEGYRLSFFGGNPLSCHTAARSNADTSRVQVHLNRTPSPPLPDPMQYPLDQLLLMNHLAPRGGVIVHSASAVVDGRALVFPGVSRAGKSTLSRLFVAAGLEGTLLSDDRTIIRGPIAAGPAAAFEAWGTPWPGDAHIAQNAHAPLAALLFLVQAPGTEVLPVPPAAAMRRLMPMVSCPWYDADRGTRVLDTCARVVETIPCFDLHFRPDDEVVPLLTSLAWLPHR